MLNQFEMQKDDGDTNRFEIAEINVSESSNIAGRTLADLRFRQKYGATLAGIRRGRDQITTINPAERLMAGDRLIIIGKAGAVRKLKNHAPL